MPTDKVRNVILQPSLLLSTLNEPSSIGRTPSLNSTKMDYSSTIQDSEDPVGASPWGNSPVSSPSRNAPAFHPISGDNPPPPLRYNSQSSNGYNQEHSASESGEIQHSSTATTASGTEDETQDFTTQESSTLAPSQSGSTAAPQPTGNQGSPAPGEQQSQPVGVGLHQGQQTQNKRPPQPQFRLQAKITGLERTGKKDPILRFDVHV